jgi:hypothetical protein
MGSICLYGLAQEMRVELNPGMVKNEAGVGDPGGLVDEQRLIVGPPAGKPSKIWQINSQHDKNYPYSAHIDLRAEKNLSTLWLFDTHNKGDVVISTGKPGAWKEVATYDCGTYMQWTKIQLDVRTRYLRFTRMTAGAQFTEIALYEHRPEAYQAMLDRKAVAAEERTARLEMLKKAREEALKRPLTKTTTFGTLSLIDEVDLGADNPGHMLRLDGKNKPEIRTILGRRCRILPKTVGECTYMTVRMGTMKLLRPGGAYVLAVEYPEDAPRSMVVINTGNETSRGFHTGAALGDAMHCKYVNNFVESLDLPLSGKWEQYMLLFRLHDRFPEKGLVRGSQVPRTLSPEDGFDVSIAQFSTRNIPMSQGAAVSRIRLYEVLDPDKLAMPLQLPPKGLPRRRIFWREEMADGVIGGKKPEDRGVDEALEWYRYKAELMRFLGINTFTKDLLEFGACQHWDSTPYGGNEWVYHNSERKGLWAEIVELMGTYGFEVLPYYEYSGSKGAKGLGNQRRAKPLARDDAYTHIKWIESANADVTDPDTLTDFQKMLDLTVINLRGKANFAGIWIRPRSQMPVGFGPGTLKRFAAEANDGKAVTRADIKDDRALYDRYVAWWQSKRRDFFTSARDHLRAKGVDDAVVLFTGCPAEPGVGFGDWDPRFVTDRPDAWNPVLAREEHKPGNDRQWTVLTPKQVSERGDYLKGLTSPGLNWGSWEVHHARPADDPMTYKKVEGVMLSHAFNRLYTVSSPKTLEFFRAPAGLAVVRHYGLNENMMFDHDDKSKLGYFVADIERAGPYCMQSEVVAVANGDPTMIGYLSGGNFGRGFPRYVRDFNANFLALPALPSRLLPGASSDPDVVVRMIQTAKHGTYFAVANTAVTLQKGVKIRLPGTIRSVTAIVSGRKLEARSGVLALNLQPCRLVALHSPR